MAQHNMVSAIFSLPGNDDSAAMASLLVFHILGLYPVISTTQMLIGSPMVSSFSLRNDVLGTTTKFTVTDFDSTSLASFPPEGSRVYVKSIMINGVQSDSICAISWSDVVGGGEIVIQVDSDATAAQARGCGGLLPDSLATGGFSN